MSLADLLVRGRMLRADGSVGPGGFRVRDGRIVGLGAEGDARAILDFGDALVVPGAIDAHVHFRDPGAPQKEDFASGTRAAALGGVTTVMDMPNTSPPTLTVDALAQKRAIAEAKACVDFGLYAGLDDVGASLAIFPQASAVKIYLGATTGHLLVRDMELVRRALVAARAAGRTVAFHAESQACLDAHAHLSQEGSFPSHATSRPAACEADAVRALAALKSDARIHLAHLSTKAGLDAMQGTSFSAEVCPHHLLFTDARLREGGAFKMNPPLRHAEDVAALWDALRSGRIASIASDHAPHTPGEKAQPHPGCPAGVPGVQTLVPLLLEESQKGRIPLARLVDASVAAARLFGLPRKGALAPGYDADFAVYDLRAAREVRASEMASKAGWTPFEGMPAIFPTDVFVRGAPVVLGSRFVGEAGSGRFVAPGL